MKTNLSRLLRLLSAFGLSAFGLGTLRAQTFPAAATSAVTIESTDSAGSILTQTISSTATTSLNLTLGTTTFPTIMTTAAGGNLRLGANTLTISSAGTLNLNAGTLTGSGSYTISGSSGFLNLGANSLTLFGPGALNLNGGTLSSFGTPTIGGTGTLTLSTGATLSASTSGTLNLNAGTLTGSGSYTISGSSGFLNLGANSLTLSGTGALNLNGGTLSSFGTPTIGGAGTLTLSAGATLSASTSGTLNLNAGTLTGSGSYTISGSSGFLNLGANSLTLSGTGALNLNGGTLSSFNSPTLGGTGTLTLSAGATLTDSGTGTISWGPISTFANSLTYDDTITLATLVGNSDQRATNTGLVNSFIGNGGSAGHRPVIATGPGTSYTMGSNGGSRVDSLRWEWWSRYGYGGPGYLQFGGSTGGYAGPSVWMYWNGGGSGGSAGNAFYGDNIAADNGHWGEWASPQTTGTGSYLLNGCGFYHSFGTPDPIYLLLPNARFTTVSLYYVFGTGGGTISMSNSQALPGGGGSVSVSSAAATSSTSGLQVLTFANGWNGTGSDNQITLSVSGAVALGGIRAVLPTGGVVDALGLGGQSDNTFSQLLQQSLINFAQNINASVWDLEGGKNDLGTYTSAQFQGYLNTMATSIRTALPAIPIIIDVPWFSNNMSGYQGAYANVTTSMSGYFPTATASTGSVALTVASAQNLAVGNIVSGTSIPATATISAFSGTTVTLSAATTGTISGATVWIGTGTNGSEIWWSDSLGAFPNDVYSDNIHPGPNGVVKLGRDLADYASASAGLPAAAATWQTIDTSPNLITNTASDSSFTGAGTHWTGDNWAGSGTVTQSSGFLQINAPNSNNGGGMLTSANFGGALTPGQTYQLTFTAASTGVGYMSFYTYDGTNNQNWPFLSPSGYGGGNIAGTTYVVQFTPKTAVTSINLLLAAGSASWHDQITNVILQKVSAAALVGDHLVAPAGIVGTAGGSSATAGYVGEIMSSSVATGASTTISTATATLATSLVLTAGDWDVEGNLNYSLLGATTTSMAAAINTVSNSLPVDGTEVYSALTLTTTTTTTAISLPRKRYTLTASTTIYLDGQGTFSAGGEKIFGTLTARRAR